MSNTFEIGSKFDLSKDYLGGIVYWDLNKFFVRSVAETNDTTDKYILNKNLMTPPSMKAVLKRASVAVAKQHGSKDDEFIADKAGEDADTFV